MLNRTFDSEYKIEIETNNRLQRCIVAGNANSHIEEEPNGKIHIEITTDKLLPQPGSSWSCPSFLGPIKIKGTLPSEDSLQFNGNVSVQHPHFPFFPDVPIEREVNVTTDTPINPEVKHLIGEESKGNLAQGTAVDASIKVKKYFHIPGLSDAPTERIIKISPAIPENKKFHVELLGDVFKWLPLPYTTLKGSFERKLPEKQPDIQNYNPASFFKNNLYSRQPLLLSERVSDQKLHHKF